MAWVGDGTNVLVSLAEIAKLTGMEVVAACPEGYHPPAGTPLTLVADPREAAAGADVLVTDIWVSLGQEETREKRLADLEPYRLDEGLVALAGPEAIVLHCLPRTPARRSPRARSTAGSRRSGTRPRTACTCRRHCWRSCSDSPTRDPVRKAAYRQAWPGRIS